MESHNIRNLTVVKHHDLNQASYKLSLDERRVILTAIGLVNPQDDFPEYIKITSKHYAKQWGTDKDNAYRTLKTAKVSLYERSIRIKSDDVVRDIRWIYETQYADGEGYIKLYFSPPIKPFLSNLKKHFTSYNLTEVKSFKSGHAIRLYELLMQFKKNGWYNESVSNLKEKFGVENNYPAWYEFRRNVIESAIKEINSATNYTVKYETQKRGRNISRVKFFFALNPQPDMFK
jgi:plasmid replication initiation protein